MEKEKIESCILVGERNLNLAPYDISVKMRSFYNSDNKKILNEYRHYGIPGWAGDWDNELKIKFVFADTPCGMDLYIALEDELYDYIGFASQFYYGGLSFDLRYCDCKFDRNFQGKNFYDFVVPIYIDYVKSCSGHKNIKSVDRKSKDEYIHLCIPH